MRTFLQRHEDQILGVLSGFDRLRFRGTLRMLSTVGGMLAVLGRLGVLLKDFKTYAQRLTEQLRASVEAVGQQAGRPVRYLASYTNKEELVRGIQQREGTAASGLVVILSTLESCHSYEIFRDRQQQELKLRGRARTSAGLKRWPMSSRGLPGRTTWTGSCGGPRRTSLPSRRGFPSVPTGRSSRANGSRTLPFARPRPSPSCIRRSSAAGSRRSPAATCCGSWDTKYRRRVDGTRDWARKSSAT